MAVKLTDGYSKAKGSKGISGAQKGSGAKAPKSKPSNVQYCGIRDGRPASNDRKQSAL